MARRRVVTLGIVAALLSLAPIGWASFHTWRWLSTPEEGPLIGISQSVAWHSRLGLSNTTYQTSLALAKARIMEFRPGDGTPAEILDQIDGLLIAGGADVNPKVYGGDPAAAVAPNDTRDAFETILIRDALRRDIPILGICRGVQLLNVLHGGTLRNIRAEDGIGPRHGGKIEWQHEHAVNIGPGSLLAHVEGVASKRVNSYHGQAVGRLGGGLVAAAISPDGVIEAVERPSSTFVVGVQWHPEILAIDDKKELRILDAFVAAATQYARRRDGAAATETEQGR